MKVRSARQAQPSLPQQDNNQTSRQTLLSHAKQIYTWDDNKPNLKGIPMAGSSVFKQSLRNVPSLLWAIKVLEIALGIFENLLTQPRTPPNQRRKQAHCIWANLAVIVWRLGKIGLILALKIYRAWSGNSANSPVAPHSPQKHSAFVWALTKAVVLPMVSNARMEDTLGEVYLQFNDYLTNTHAPLVTEQSGLEPGLEGFAGIFKTVPIPITAQQLLDDAAFARYRLAGPNPMLLQGITAIPSKFAVTEAGYKQVMPDDTLQQALKERRIFLLDFIALTALFEHPGNKRDNQTGPAIKTEVMVPMALFALSKDRQQFKAVAIQVYQSATALPVVYATQDVIDPSYWDWQTAKTLVQNADTNYQELLAHLARTHLLIEAFAVATPRYLAKRHPVAVLLRAHLEGSLFINSLAEKILVKPNGNVDKIFGSDIRTVQIAARDDRLRLDFYDAMLPNDLKRRGLDDPAHFPDYPYRDDGLLLWNAIAEWVTAYLALYYTDDVAVQNDTELAAWTHGIMTEGKVKGFKIITSSAQLTEVLTMIIFTASAQHAAVNFPQSSMETYTPAFPGSVVGVKPLTGNTEASWLALFPPLFVAQAQLDLFQLLGSVYYSRLGDYRKNRFPYTSIFSDSRVTQAHGPLEQFKVALQAIEAAIVSRNHTRVPYTFLQPSNVPASINI